MRPGSAEDGARGPRSDALVNRQRLLDAATVAVHREGTAVPMATVASDAGVGVGTLYRHFPTREALLDELTYRSFELVLANVVAADAAGGTGLSGVDRFIDTAIGHRDQLVLPLSGGPPIATQRTGALRDEVHRHLQRLIDRGVADGSIRDGVTARDVVFFGGMLAQPNRPGRAWTTAARRLKDYFILGLADEQVSPPG